MIEDILVPYFEFLRILKYQFLGCSGQHCISSVEAHVIFLSCSLFILNSYLLLLTVALLLSEVFVKLSGKIVPVICSSLPTFYQIKK